jgi:hypothetical protein
MGSRDLLQFVTRAARFGKIPHREHALDASRQKTRPQHRLCRLT